MAIRHKLHSILKGRGEIVKLIRQLDCIEHLAHLHTPAQCALDSCPARMTFVGFGTFLLKCLSDSERKYLFQHVLPSIITFAISVECIKNTHLYYSYENRDYDIFVPYPVSVSLVACAFLCILPIHPTLHFHLDQPNFFNFFRKLESPHSDQSQHLLSLISYFEHCSMRSFVSRDLGALRLIRLHLKVHVPTSAYVVKWHQLSASSVRQLFYELLKALRHVLLPSVFVDKSRHQETVSDKLHLPMTHFVNSYVGNGVLNSNPLENNPLFLRYPDLLAVLPICHRLEGFESIWIDHYRGPFMPVPPGVENSYNHTARDTIRWRRLVLVNSAYSPCWAFEFQYCLSSLFSELAKSTAAFFGLGLTEPNKSAVVAPFSPTWWSSLLSLNDRNRRIPNTIPVQSVIPTYTQRLCLLRFAWSYVAEIITEAKADAVNVCLLIKDRRRFSHAEAKAIRNSSSATSRRLSLPNIGNSSHKPTFINGKPTLSFASTNHGRKCWCTQNCANGIASGLFNRQFIEQASPSLFTSVELPLKIYNTYHVSRMNSPDSKISVKTHELPKLGSLVNAWTDQILKESSVLALNFYRIASNYADRVHSCIFLRIMRDLRLVGDGYTQSRQLTRSISVQKTFVDCFDGSTTYNQYYSHRRASNCGDTPGSTSGIRNDSDDLLQNSISARSFDCSDDHFNACNTHERASCTSHQSILPTHSLHPTQIVSDRSTNLIRSDCSTIAFASRSKSASPCKSSTQVLPERILSHIESIAMDCCIEAVQLARLQRLQGRNLTSVGCSITRPPGLVTTGWGPDSMNPDGDSQLKVITQWIAAAVASSSVFLNDVSRSLKSIFEGDVRRRLPLSECYLSPLVICTNRIPQLSQLQEVVDLIGSSGWSAGSLLSAVSDYSVYRLRCMKSTVHTDCLGEAPGVTVMSLFDFLLNRLRSTVKL